MTDGHQFTPIVLGRYNSSFTDFVCSDPGHLRIHSGGIVWQTQGGGNVVELHKSNIDSIDWMPTVSRVFELHIRLNDIEGSFYCFISFREQDVTSVSRFVLKNIGITPRMKRDPNMPKRMSAFMLFSNYETDNIKKAYPRLASSQVKKMLEDKWKELPEKERREYQMKELLDRRRYHDEMRDYRKTGPMFLLADLEEEKEEYELM